MRIAFLVDALNETGGTEISSEYFIRALGKEHEVRTFLLHRRMFKGELGKDTKRYCIELKKGGSLTSNKRRYCDISKTLQTSSQNWSLLP